MKKPTSKNMHSRRGILLAMLFQGCAKQPETTGQDSDTVPDLAILPGLSFVEEEAPQYANHFTIYRYEKGCLQLVLDGTDRYLLIPEGSSLPDGVETSPDITVLQLPLSDIYLADSSSMAWFRALNAMDAITFSATKASGWYIDEAKEAMESGKITYAGKYSEPDYEMLLEWGCDLAIENTMLSHKPKVKEMLESIGVPVFISLASREESVLGRMEWVKVFGALTGNLKEAYDFFDDQVKQLDAMELSGDYMKSVAFFYISSNGYVVVRKSTDYVADMIHMAGGEYLPADLTEEGGRSSVNLSMEEFYADCRDADILIYNSTVQSPVQSMEELLAKSELLSEFKAVQEGHVWCVGKDLYQSPDIAAQMILDINRVLKEPEARNLTFLERIL